MGSRKGETKRSDPGELHWTSALQHPGPSEMAAADRGKLHFQGLSGLRPGLEPSTWPNTSGCPKVFAHRSHRTTSATLPHVEVRVSQHPSRTQTEFPLAGGAFSTSAFGAQAKKEGRPGPCLVDEPVAVFFGPLWSNQKRVTLIFSTVDFLHFASKEAGGFSAFCK